MADTGSADGAAVGPDAAGHLSRIGSRTSLMVIDATLHALAKPAAGAGDAPLLEAATDVRALARRMAQAALDFQASLDVQAPPDGAPEPQPAG